MAFSSIKRNLSGVVAAAMMLGIVGCGGGDDSGGGGGASSGGKTSKATASKTPSGKTGKTTDSGQDTKEPEAVGIGKIVGKITLDGPTPDAVRVLVAKGDKAAKDSEVCAANDIIDDSLQIGTDNGIGNVFVFLSKAPKGVETPDPESLDPVLMDQKGCVFEPHAAVLQVKQTLLVTSSDPVQHNVHTMPKRNSQTNLLCPPNEKNGLKVVYAKPEREPVRVKCDIHPWMMAFQLPLDHPFAAITQPDGSFTIEGVPAGTHTVKVWHERAGFLESDLEVEVKADGTATIEKKYEAAKFPETANLNLKTITIVTSH